VPNDLLLDGRKLAGILCELAVDADGQKLSKATQAEALPNNRPAAVMHRALKALGQSPIPELARAPLRDVWSWAFEHWRLAKVAGQTSVPVVQPLY